MFPERIKRVEREIQRVLADVLRDLKDPRLAGVNITAVEVSKDLRTGRVFISTLKDEELPGALDALQRAAGRIGHALGDELDLRRIPKLSFLHDPTLANAAKIDALLARVVPKEDEGAACPPDESAERDGHEPSDV